MRFARYLSKFESQLFCRNWCSSFWWTLQENLFHRLYSSLFLPAIFFFQSIIHALLHGCEGIKYTSPWRESISSGQNFRIYSLNPLLYEMGQGKVLRYEWGSQALDKEHSRKIQKLILSMWSAFFAQDWKAGRIGVTAVSDVMIMTKKCISLQSSIEPGKVAWNHVTGILFQQIPKISLPIVPLHTKFPSFPLWNVEPISTISRGAPKTKSIYFA